MWIGKLVAGLIGLSTGGLLGGIIGLAIGHYFDKGLENVFGSASREDQARIQRQFFRTVFQLLGKLAKTDGRVSEEEVAHTEYLMRQMGLHGEHRREAIEFFKQGSQPEFSVDEALREFNAVCGRNLNLKRMLLNYLVSLALADGELAEPEEFFLRQVAGHLGISPALFDQLMGMIKAQTRFRGYQSRDYQPGRSDKYDLDTAYAALGIPSSSTDAEVKRAYRKLISENHPDKLMGQGVPEDMIKLATERSQEIQTAYDLIKAARSI